MVTGATSLVRTNDVEHGAGSGPQRLGIRPQREASKQMEGFVADGRPTGGPHPVFVLHGHL